MNFKVGDKIRFKKGVKNSCCDWACSNCSYYHDTDYVIVTRIRTDGKVDFKHPKNEHHCGCKVEALEHIKISNWKDEMGG